MEGYQAIIFCNEKIYRRYLIGGGELLLPLLTWFLLYRIQKRISSANDGKLAIHTSGACSPKLLIFFGLKRQNFEKKCIFNLPLLPTNCQSICQPD